MDKAEYFIHGALPNLRVKKISNSFQEIIEAARIKAKHPLSYSDCFVREPNFCLLVITRKYFSLDRGIIGCPGECVHISVREAVAKARMEEQEEK